MNPIPEPVSHDIIGTMSWDETITAIKAESLKMDEIHIKFPGKENRREREIALRPYTAACVSLHYRRIDLVRFNTGVEL